MGCAESVESYYDVVGSVKLIPPPPVGDADGRTVVDGGGNGDSDDDDSTEDHGDGDEDLGGELDEKLCTGAQRICMGFLTFEHRTGYEDRRWVVPHYGRGEEPRRGLSKGGFDWSNQTGRLNPDLVADYAGAFKAGDVTHGCLHCGKLLRLGTQTYSVTSV